MTQVKFKECNITLCQYIIRDSNEPDSKPDIRIPKQELLLFEISKEETCLDAAITKGHR